MWTTRVPRKEKIPNWANLSSPVALQQCLQAETRTESYLPEGSTGKETVMPISTTSSQTTDIWENTSAIETLLSTTSSCSFSSWSASYTRAHMAVGHQTRYQRQLVLSSLKGCVSGTKKPIWKLMVTNKKHGKRQAGVLQGQIYCTLPHGLHVLLCVPVLDLCNTCCKLQGHVHAGCVHPREDLSLAPCHPQACWLTRPRFCHAPQCNQSSSR